MLPHTARSITGTMATLLQFDDDCGLCTHSVRWLVRKGFDGELEGLPAAEAGESVVAVVDSEVLRGVAAVSAALMRCRPPWPWVGRLLRLPGVRRVAGWIYPAIASRRGRISARLGWQRCEISARPPWSAGS
jgi:predicted DCC family thiol-disulfide oxidoreductase YuxK